MSCGKPPVFWLHAWPAAFICYEQHDSIAQTIIHRESYIRYAPLRVLIPNDGLALLNGNTWGHVRQRNTRERNQRTDCVTGRQEALDYPLRDLHVEAAIVLVHDDDPAVEACGLVELLVDPGTIRQQPAATDAICVAHKFHVPDRGSYVSKLV